MGKPYYMSVGLANIHNLKGTAPKQIGRGSKILSCLGFLLLIGSITIMIIAITSQGFTATGSPTLSPTLRPTKNPTKLPTPFPTQTPGVQPTCICDYIEDECSADI